MSTSTDGGLTWGPATPTGGLETGLGGQPVVQPNGTVVVPYTSGNEIRVFHSTDGGANWTRPRLDQPRHRPRGRRESPHVGAPLGRGRRRRPRVRRLARLPLPSKLQLERHRDEHGHRPVHVDVADPDPDRSDERAGPTTSSQGSRSTARPRVTPPGSRSRTTTTRSPRATRARASSRSGSSPRPTAVRRGRSRATWPGR